MLLYTIIPDLARVEIKLDPRDTTIVLFTREGRGESGSRRVGIVLKEDAFGWLLMLKKIR